MVADGDSKGAGSIARRSFLSHGALLAGGAVGAATLTPGVAGASLGGVVPTVVVTVKTAAGIQAAINALPATGGIVQLQPGVYTLGKSVVLHNGTQLVGAGRGSTVLRLLSGANVPAVRNADQVTGDIGIAIRDLTIDGNRTQQGQTGNAHGIRLYRCSNLVLDGLEVMQCDGSGILVTGDGMVTRIASVTNVYAHDNAVHGIWVTFAMREVAYTGVTCDLNGQDGLVIDHSEAVANGLHCSRNVRDGIRITNVVANNLTGILADLNGRTGIRVMGFVNSVGAAWAAHGNGQHEPASDVHFDGTINTYGLTNHAIVSGIECGGVQQSSWGPPYPMPNVTTETFGLTVDPVIQGNLALIGVRNCGGTTGTYSLGDPGSTGALVILDVELATNQLRLLRGSLHLAGGDLVHDDGGRLGFYGAPATDRPTVSGDKVADPGGVILSLLGALASLGLVADETT